MEQIGFFGTEVGYHVAVALDILVCVVDSQFAHRFDEGTGDCEGARGRWGEGARRIICL